MGTFERLPLTLFLVFCLSSICFSLSPGAPLADQLRGFEVLHHKDVRITHRHKRSLTDVPEQDVTLDVLGKHFLLRLHPQRDLFSKYFRAYDIDSGNERHIFKLDKSQFLEGNVAGKKSRVYAYFEHKNLMATIVTEEDTYVIEPSWRHLPKSDNHTMIAYKKSDMKLEGSNAKGQPGGSYCGFVHADGEDEAASPARDIKEEIFGVKSKRSLDPSHLGRQKRQTSTKVVCTLLLVGDYHFVSGVGQGDTVTAAKYMVGQVQKTNVIFQETNFKGYTGLGFEIRSVKTYSQYTAEDGHHNMQKTVWAEKDLLKAFSKDPDHKTVCLSHLFTNIAYSNGVLGLAWIAGSAQGSVGGICSPSAGAYSYNTAFTTHKNQVGNRVLTEQAFIVTAHEFGHNWGSPHDPATSECDPGGFSGGSYIMQSKSVDGSAKNNKNFSPCSTRAIGEVLINKKESCFSEKSAYYCGNSFVESPYEECDAGPDGLLGNDPCCDDKCTLRTTATCSDKNSLCCQNCQSTAAGTLCRDNGALNTTCEGNGFCDGTSFDCPSNTNKPDGTSCVDNGKCQGGQCLGLCEQIGKLSCICDDITQACFTCCKNSTDGLCGPYIGGSGALEFLSDGKPCKQGYCTAGVCQKVIGQFTDRLWKVIENINIDNLAVFMKNNLVITCIILSLILFIPCAIIIGIVDWRRDASEKDEDAWYSKSNTSLYMENDTKQIRRTFTRKRPATRVETASGTRSKNRIYPEL